MNAFQFNLVLGGVLCCSLAPAAEVTLEFRETRAGEWDVLAEIVPEDGDTIGIAGFGFEVIGVDPNSIDFTLAPLSAVDPMRFEFVGFTQPPIFDRSSSEFFMRVTQATRGRSTELVNLGIEPVMIDGPGDFDLSTEVPIKLGSLTTPTGLAESNFGETGVELLPSYYFQSLVGGILTYWVGKDSGLNVVVTPIPEPSTLAFATLALAAVVVRRRRKN